MPENELTQAEILELVDLELEVWLTQMHAKQGARHRECAALEALRELRDEIIAAASRKGGRVRMDDHEYDPDCDCEECGEHFGEAYTNEQDTETMTESVVERVAKACGIPADEVARGGVRHFIPDGDYEDALDAAERFGLFDKHQCLLGREDGRWGVYREDTMAHVAHGDTFCAAICNAILALAEKDARETADREAEKGGGA